MPLLDVQKMPKTLDFLGKIEGGKKSVSIVSTVRCLATAQGVAGKEKTYKRKSWVVCEYPSFSFTGHGR